MVPQPLQPCAHDAASLGCGSASSAMDALVRCVKSRDTRAFERVVDYFWASLVRAVQGIVRDEGRAEDVVQETLLAAWTHIDRVQDGNHLAPWMYRVARNKAVSLIRNECTRPTIHAPKRLEHGLRKRALASGSRPTASPCDLHEAVRRSVASLPNGLAAMIDLHYVQGRTTREIADLLGVRRSTVKMRLLRARQMLGKTIPKAVQSADGCAHYELKSWTQRVNARASDRDARNDP